MKLSFNVKTYYVLERQKVNNDLLIWKEKELIKPIKGIFTGYRYLQNGFYIEKNQSFKEVNRFKVALLTVNVWRNPVYVMPEKLRRIYSFRELYLMKHIIKYKHKIRELRTKLHYQQSNNKRRKD